MRIAGRGWLRTPPKVPVHAASVIAVALAMIWIRATLPRLRYDQLIEATRPKLNAPELRSPAVNTFRRLLFALLPYPKRLRAALTPLRAYALLSRAQADWARWRIYFGDERCLPG